MMQNSQINLENTKAQMRKGILEFCVLLIIAKDKVYVSDIIQELLMADLLVVEGTLYPLLARLKNAGLLAYDWEESPSGPPRKYYSLTPEGRKFLRELESTWNNLDISIGKLIKKFK